MNSCEKIYFCGHVNARTEVFRKFVLVPNVNISKTKSFFRFCASKLANEKNKTSKKKIFNLYMGNSWTVVANKLNEIQRRKVCTNKLRLCVGFNFLVQITSISR